MHYLSHHVRKILIFPQVASQYLRCHGNICLRSSLPAQLISNVELQGRAWAESTLYRYTECKSLPDVRSVWVVLIALLPCSPWNSTGSSSEMRFKKRKKNSKTLLQVDSLFPFSSKHLTAFSRAPDSKQKIGDGKFLIKARSIIEV